MSWIIAIYVLILCVLGLSFGFLDDKDPSADSLAVIVMWLAIIVWPATIVLAFLMGVIYLPYYIGSNLREFVISRRGK